MARPQDPKREEARELWERSGGARGILTDIANQLGIKREQVSRWKSEDNWGGDKRNVTKSTKRNVTKPKEQKERDRSPTKEMQEALIESLDENDELTEKQRLFCFYFIQSYNAMQSYLKAYECDYDTAKAIAYRLLENVGIQEEIKRLKAIATEMKHIPSAGETLAMYGRIARADARDFVMFGTTDAIDEQGQPYKRNYLRFKEMEEVDGSVITEISLGKDGAKIKTGDKMKALQFFSKFHGLDEPKQAQIEDDGFVDALGDMSEDIWAD